MLILARKKNETIRLGDVATVRVVEIRGDKVRLGVEAPKELSVHREEIHQQVVAGGVDVTEPRVAHARVVIGQLLGLAQQLLDGSIDHASAQELVRDYAAEAAELERPLVNPAAA